MPRRQTQLKPQTYAFIDATNIIYGATQAQWQVDFQKLSTYLQKRYGVSKIYYFAGVDPDNHKQLKFYQQLSKLGYQLHLVPVKVFSNGKKKADVDSRMTFDMMYFYNRYQKVVVLTGDGDFFWILEYLKIKKQKLWLLSFPRRTARELKQLVGADFANLDNLKRLLGR